jgi:hypothetical protein
LTTLYLISAKNTDSWRAMKGDLQHAISLDVPMVPPSSVTIAVHDECLTCSGFSLGETHRSESLELLIDYLGGLSLSPMEDGSDAIAMGSSRGGPLRPRWMDSAKGFPTASIGKGRTDLPSPRGTAQEPLRLRPQPHC